jgi:hypothetical protein
LRHSPAGSCKQIMALSERPKTITFERLGRRDGPSLPRRLKSMRLLLGVALGAPPE